METVIAFLFDFNGLKQELLFEALADPMGFHFIRGKALEEHYSVHNGYLLFWYNRRDHSTHVIRRKVELYEETFTAALVG